jgi:hypothetical protein
MIETTWPNINPRNDPQQGRTLTLSSMRYKPEYVNQSFPFPILVTTSRKQEGTDINLDSPICEHILFMFQRGGGSRIYIDHIRTSMKTNSRWKISTYGILPWMPPFQSNTLVHKPEALLVRQQIVWPDSTTWGEKKFLIIRLVYEFEESIDIAHETPSSSSTDFWW